MITVTNQKVAGFAPRWTEFRGFTFLFDNPSSSFTIRNGLEYVDCDLESDNNLPFYRALWRGLASLNINELTNRYLFCQLPTASYHVTACDGINAGNLSRVVSEQRAVCADFLSGLPNSLKQHPLLPAIAESALVTVQDWSIRFRFERLEKWHNSSLVARLEAADETSQQTLVRLTAMRQQMIEILEQLYGVNPGPAFRPHASLGYFANYDLAEQATPLVEAWNEKIAASVQGQILEMQTIRLYGFTDMATFFAVQS